jgi:hypothetical protein
VTSGSHGIRLTGLRKPNESPECLRDGRRGLKECWNTIAAGNCQVLADRRAGALPAGPVGPPRAPSGAGASIRPDLAVVGGGLRPAGRAAGQERDPARSVILLEADRAGWAATGRNSGFCAASPP